MAGQLAGRTMLSLVAIIALSVPMVAAAEGQSGP